MYKEYGNHKPYYEFSTHFVWHGWNIAVFWAKNTKTDPIISYIDRLTKDKKESVAKRMNRKKRANREEHDKLSIKTFSKSFHIQTEESETEKDEQKSHLVGVFLHEWILVKYSFYFFFFFRLLIVVVINRRVYKYKQRNTRIYTRKKDNFCSHSLELLCFWFNLIVIYFFIIIIIYILFRSVGACLAWHSLLMPVNSEVVSLQLLDTVYIYTICFRSAPPAANI